MPIERCEVSSEIGIVPGSIREPDFSTMMRPRTTGYIGTINPQEYTMSTTSSVYEIEPTEYDEVTEPRLLLTDLRHLFPSDTKRPLWLTGSMWDVLRYTSVYANGRYLPLMAAISDEYTVQDYLTASYAYGWQAIARERVSVRMNLVHLTDRDATNVTHQYGTGSNEVNARFYDATWLADADTQANPWIDILRELDFNLEDIALEAGRPIADYFASGEITRGSSGYHEVIIITPDGPRAFSVPPTSDDPHAESERD